MRLFLAALALFAIASCKSALAPTEGIDQQAAISTLEPDADSPGRSSHVPTVTGVTVNTTPGLYPFATSLDIHMANLNRGQLGKDWTFSVYWAGHWTLGPGLPKYFAWVTEENWPKNELATHSYVTREGPDCAYDMLFRYEFEKLTVTRSGINVTTHSGGPGSFGHVRIFSRSDLSAPWIPAAAMCDWIRHDDPIPTQMFDFELPYSSPAVIAHQSEPAEDALTLGGRRLP